MGDSRIAPKTLKGSREYHKINGAEKVEQYSDLIKLINDYGQNGVWILDPYLTINEVANTLLRCPFLGVKLRALCVRGDNQWIKEQKDVIEKLSVEDKDLKIEVRMVSKENGLHDRFIIFPGEKKHL
jgi:predicted transcriptional regulator